MKKIDIRNHGSGNAGATNTLRVLGLGPALFVLACDIGKGIGAVWIGGWLGDGSIWVQVFSGLAVIVGHNWPIFFGFRGGKGIATTIGVLATLCFIPALLAGVIAIASIVIWRYVSLGSLLFTALTPVFLLLLDGYPEEMTWISLIIFLMAAIRHRKNVVKLWRKEENKIRFRRKEGSQ